ncbi:MAG: cytochrome b/b6 domain-containing protein [Chromatiaceae bacterium]|nr:cytochrome b/b6 domain-containing protein [Chromatiaceae bacterium]MCP5314486.1 cytochrome b/b6 domain-containing protein [Chromatiaceae bacterium]
MYKRFRHSLVTRLLHIGLSFGVTLQLLLSTFMQKPKSGIEYPWLETIGFELHEMVGLLLMSLTLAWFAWLFVRRQEDGLGALFPWFSTVERSALFTAGRRALIAARNLSMPDDSDGYLIARAVHGLGALCALGMAFTGSLVWLGMSEPGEIAGWALPALEVHQILATFMWAYLVGHAGMAWLHDFRGEALVRRMFSFRGRDLPDA